MYNYFEETIKRFMLETKIKEAKAEVIEETPKGKRYISTTYVTDHHHWYAIDQDGSGFTLGRWAYPYDGLDGDDVGANDHRHEVKNWIILTAKGHDHNLPFRVAQQDKLGDKIIEDPMTMDEVNKDNVDDNLLDTIETPGK